MADLSLYDKHTGGVQAGPPKPPTPPPGPPPLAHAVGCTSTALAMPLGTPPVIAKWGARPHPTWVGVASGMASGMRPHHTCPMHPTCQATPKNKRNAFVAISKHVHVLKSTPSHKWHVKWGTLLWLWALPWHVCCARAMGAIMACAMGAAMACVCACV